MGQLWCIQHWIPSRNIDSVGKWYFDLSDLFASLHEAQTQRAEFFADGLLTRIVRLDVSEAEVVEEYDERHVVQAMLFV